MLIQERHGMILIENNSTEKSVHDITDSVYEIEKACFSTPWSKRSLESQIFTDSAVFAVIYDNDTAAGYITGQIVADECELYRIAVLPQYRKQRLATRLMEYFLDKCEENNVKSIFLEVRSGNAPARSLYEKSGFKVLAVRKNYYSNPGEDAVIYGTKSIE